MQEAQASHDEEVRGRDLGRGLEGTNNHAQRVPGYCIWPNDQRIPLPFAGT